MWRPHFSHVSEIEFSFCVFRGVTVNAIAPGPFLTDMPKASFSEEQKEKVGHSVLNTPLL